MSELSVVTFHTAPPGEIFYPYQRPPYREVVGFSSGGSDLWTPRAGEGYRSEEYNVDSKFAKTLRTFFESWFENPDLAWTCHMAAAGMRGLENWHDEPTARQYGKAIWEEGLDGPSGRQQLRDGQQGVYVTHRLDHSVVGLGEDEHIQLNETDGKYASIVPAAYNDEYSFASPNAHFYASK
jgi:hypothetical protein